MGGMRRVCGRRLKGAARLFFAVAMVCVGWASSQATARALAADEPSANVTVVATGLNGPRGLTFGPDGNLYVAEAGMGGKASTAGTCEQVPGPVGPYTGGKTARISRITPGGARTTVVDGLPSGISSLPSGDTLGAEDVEFVGSALYALIAGGGCSHGITDFPNTIIKVNTDGTYSTLGDLGAFQRAHPVAKPDTEDFEPDGTWYSMANVGGVFYAMEPNHGELVKVTPDGQISRVVDISASQGHIVPTAMVYHDGAFYVSNLGGFPVMAGDARVLKITLTGEISVVATGLEAVVDLAFDGQGRMYALELSTEENAPPMPGTGKVLRMTASGGWETIASGLSVPTAMTYGPDGDLYVANLGAAPPGAGQIVRITLSSATPAPVSVPTAPRTGDGGAVAFIRRLGDG